MKKLLIGLTLLISMSSFANNTYEIKKEMRKGDTVTYLTYTFELPTEMKCIDSYNFGELRSGSGNTKKIFLNIESQDGAIDIGSINVLELTYTEPKLDQMDPDERDALLFVTAPLWIIPVGVGFIVDGISSSFRLKGLLEDAKASLKIPACK